VRDLGSQVVLVLGAQRGVLGRLGHPPDLDLALAREAAHPLDRLPPRRHVDQPVPGRQRGVFRGDRRAVLDDTSTIGEFLDWLTGDQKVRLMRWGTRQDPNTGHTWETWVPDHRSIEQLLADYFGLDLDAIGREQQALHAQLAEHANAAPPVDTPPSA